MSARVSSVWENNSPAEQSRKIKTNRGEYLIFIDQVTLVIFSISGNTILKGFISKTFFKLAIKYRSFLHFYQYVLSAKGLAIELG
jgi:hypothetical protein